MANITFWKNVVNKKLSYLLSAFIYVGKILWYNLPRVALRKVKHIQINIGQQQEQEFCVNCLLSFHFKATVLLYLIASLPAVPSFYCDAIVQLFTECLSSGCHLLLLWCYCATLDWEPLFLLYSAFTVVLLCKARLRASLPSVLSFYCDAIAQLLTEFSEDDLYKLLAFYEILYHTTLCSVYMWT